MCTQKRHSENKEHQSRHGNRHGGHCIARRLQACSRNSTAGTKPDILESRLTYLKSTSWYPKTLCYNSSSSKVDGGCLLAEQSIHCRHIICLLFACLAMSASAESTTSGYDVTSSPQPDVIQSQNVSVLEDKNASIPLKRQGSFENGKKNVTSTVLVTPPLASDRIQQAIPEVDSVNSLSKDHVKNAEPKLSVKNENADEESVYFILNVFHRYSENDFLLKTDFEKLFANIGLIPALNNSDNSDDHEHGHNDSHHHHHHEEKDTGHLGKLPEAISHDHSSDFTAIFNNESVPTSSASLQEEISGRQHTQQAADVTTTAATSHMKRQRRSVSPHQHGEHNKCLSTEELLQVFQYEKVDTLNADQFWHLCPALIDQLDAGFCKKEPPVTGSQDLKPGGQDSSDGHQHEHSHGESDDHHQHDHHQHDHTDTHPHDHDHGGTGETGTQEQPDMQPVTAAVWLYALLSVAVISLCSVAGVVVIPNMKRVFYNHILQFLVALAVGAMSGDAMLHLLPHAMLSDSHDHHHHHHGENDTDNPHNHHEEGTSEMSSHMVGLYKGLVALMGIYSFFFLERLFTLFTRNRSGRSERKQKRRRHCGGGGHDQRSKAFHMVNSKLETDGGNAPSCEEMVMIVHPNKALRAYADVSHEAYLHRCDESLVHSPPGQNVTAVTSGRDQHTIKEDSSTLEGFTNLGVAGWSGDQVPTVVSDAEIFGIAKDAEPVSTTHSHSHSHLAPDFVGPLSSVAMMVIVGDVIHNFCDGLAIGAAYAGSLAGGLSTSVAVFCHELPHEIGDFAVLVRSGLTLKKAVYFNLVSSIPCFIGAIIGIAVGNMSSTSSWIFAGVGGMFLYVTLVDLIPEMSSVYTKSGEPWFLHLLLQASGIAVGTTIMLIISVSEESLLTAFH